jgi:hypothetical protein
MTPALRPMSLGEILDRTIQIYRSRFWLFVGIATVPGLAVIAEYGAANAWLLRHPFHSQILLFRMAFPSLVWAVLLYAGGSFTHLLFRPAFIRLASGTVTNRPYTLQEAIGSNLLRWKAMVTINIIQQLTVIGVPGSIFLASVLVMRSAIAGADVDEPVIAAGFLIVFMLGGALAAFFLWSGACFSFALVAAEIERSPWRTAIKRSWSLSRKTRGRIIFTWLSIFVGSSVANLLIRMTLSWVLQFFLRSPAFWNSVPGYLVFNLLPTVVVSGLIGPIYPIALTLFYYDQRIRLEGYDIEHMIQTAGLNLPATPDAPGALAGQSVVPEGAE